MGMAAGNDSSNRYLVPAAQPEAPHTTSLEIKRSRFLAQCCHAPDAAAAKSFIGAVRALRPDASHNCWAYVAGAPGDTSRIGSSDDGEPHGTAGRPMLNALLHSGIGGICMVVSRWFGGVKLGTGGLSRAYQESALANLATLPTVEKMERASLEVALEYAHLDALLRILPAFEASLLAGEYHAAAELLIEAPLDRAGALKDAIASLSNGAARVTFRERPG